MLPGTWTGVAAATGLTHSRASAPQLVKALSLGEDPAEPKGKQKQRKPQQGYGQRGEAKNAAS